MTTENVGIARKSLFLLIYNVFGGVVGYITLFFALRFVGQDAWGIYGSALGIAGILGILSSLGVDAAHVKKVTQKKNKEECLGAYIIIKSFLGVLFLLVSFGGLYFIGTVLGFKFESPYLKIAVYIAILGMFISSFSNIFRTTYRIKLDARKSVIPLFVKVLVQDSLIIFFSVYYIFNTWINRQLIGALYSYSYLMGIFSSFVIYIGWALKDNFTVKKPQFPLLKEYILFSIPLALSGIVGTIQAYTDRTMLQFFWNSAEVGGYFSVQKLALFITFFGSSVGFFLYPAQSKFYEKKDKNFFHLTLKSERFLSMISIPFVLFTAVMAQEILNIFRASLIPYATPLIILMIYAYLYVINIPYGSQLTSANKPHEVMKVGVIQAAANVILNAIFIPKSLLGVPLFGWKSTGAALATLLSFLIGFVYLRYKVYSILGVKYEKHIFLHIIAGVCASMVIYLLKVIFGQFLSWYYVFGSFILFIIIYFGALYLLREFGKEELDLIMRLKKLNKFT